MMLMLRESARGRRDTARRTASASRRDGRWRRVLAGAAAGAAGTTALDVVTYLDMAVRGRPASHTPEQSLERLLDLVHVRLPADPETRQNRLSGLAPLAGLLTGTTVGAGFGALDSVLDGALGRSRAAAGLATVAAMTGTNLAMTVLGVTDPREWSKADWLEDLVPHLAYGLVTALTYTAQTGATHDEGPPSWDGGPRTGVNDGT